MHFDFISEQGTRKTHRDEATKHLIRRRATQAAALTKRREGTIKDSDLQQPLPWIVNDSVQETNTNLIETSGESVINGYPYPTYPCETILQSLVSSIPNHLPPIHYTESIPCLLSMPTVQAHLVGSLLGRFTQTKDHIRIGKLLKLSDPEFLSQLSAKYGQSPTLDAAIICLVARIKEFLSAPPPNETPRRLYGRALHALQQSLSIDTTEKLENTWFTTPTLALFELLDSSSHIPWILHTRGAANMLKRVGPQGIVTEPQKVLLATQTPIMIIEALMSAGSCFLDEDEWQLALENTITEGPPMHFRTVMIVHLFKIAAKVPNLFNQVTDCIKTRTETDILRLKRRLLELKSAYSIWDAHWKHIMDYTFKDPDIEAKRVFHRANSYGYAAMIDRLLLALDCSQYLELETAALARARQAAEVANATSSIRLAYARVISDSLIRTSAQWQEYCMFADGRLVDKSVFLDWARAMERPVE